MQPHVRTTVSTQYTEIPCAFRSKTATDPNLFQAPFRAGIKIDAYQMEPLRKALQLPRVDLPPRLVPSARLDY